MTNDIRDIQNADVVLLTGSNPTENHPVLSTVLKQAIRSGSTTLIVVEPRDIGICRFAEKKLSPRPGTDVAWVNGMMNVIIAENLYDTTFVAERTEGFVEVKREVEPYTPEYVENISGIPATDLVEAARLYAKAPAASIVYAMGITQHATGTDNVKSLANLAMLCGNMGIKGGGVNPLRGQNNVQGACDLGALPNVYTGYQKVAEAPVREKFGKAWKTDLPEEPGLTVMELMNGAHDGTIKSLYIIGENPMISDPDVAHTQASLENLDFLVVQDIFLTETAKMADVVLPSACFAEKDGTFTNSERRVSRVRKAVDAPGNAREDWAITCDIATRMGYPMSYESAEKIFEEIASLTPSYGGMSYARIDRTGLHWPCPSTDHAGTPILHVGKFTRGKGLFHAVKYAPPAENADGEYPLLLTTGRQLYHYHSATMTRKTEGLSERAPSCFVEISSADATPLGITEGSMVKVRSRRGEIEVEAHVSDTIVAGTVFVPFHYAEAAANRLTNTVLDPVSKIPELKVCAVELTPLKGRAGKKDRKRWGQLDIRHNTKEITDQFVEFLAEEKKMSAKEEIDSVLQAYRNRRGAIIPVLQKVQQIVGFLPPVVQHYVALGLNLPSAHVYGIVTFYSFFTQKPRGEHIIRVCMGTACYVMGAGEIVTKFRDSLNVDVGETTPDRLFTLETVRCLGACGLAPVVMVDDETYGYVTPDKVAKMLATYRDASSKRGVHAKTDN